MARLWSCGFELQSATSAVEWDTTVGSPSISTSTKRSGAAALRCNPTSATSYIQHRYRVDNPARVFYRVYIRFATLPSADCDILAHSDGSAHFPTVRFIQSSATLRVYDVGASAVGSPSAALTTGTWYRLEMDYTDGSGSGDSTSAYLDGAAFCTAAVAGDMFGGGVIQVGILTAVTADMYIDDIAVNDTSGSAQTGLPGAGSIVHLRPNAAGDNAGYATVVGGTTNWDRVDEITPDDATTYNATTATGTTTTDDHNVDSSATGGIGASDTITLVQVGARVGSTAATAASIVTRIKGQASGTTTESASTSVAVNGWATHNVGTVRVPGLTAYVNPQTSTAWTPSTLDTMQIGYRSNVSQSTARRISALWALVEYVPVTTVSGTATVTGAGTVTAAATIQATASIVGAGSVTAVATQGATASAAGAGTVSAILAQQAGATVTGAGTTSAAATQAAGATVAGVGAVSATALGTISGTAAVAGAGIVSAAAELAAGSSVTGSGSTSAAATQGALVTVDGQGSTAATAVQSATAPVAGVGSASAAATQVAHASVTGAGAVAATVVQAAGAAIVGAGSVSANPDGTVTGSASVTGAGVVTAVGCQSAGSAITGTGAVSALVAIGSPGAAEGLGAVTAVAGTESGASVAGLGTVSAVVSQQATASVIGVGQVSASAGGTTIFGTATVVGVGVVTARSGGRITYRPSAGVTIRPYEGITVRP